MVQLEAEKCHVWKEWYIVSGIMFQHFATGVSHGYPAILVPALMRNNSDVYATREEATWIVSSYSIAGIVGYIIIPEIQKLYGRKVGNVLVNVVVIISSIITAFATNLTTLLIGRLIQGLTVCGLYLCGYIIGEYTHPKRRGFFIILKMTTYVVGILICHSIVSVLTWRQVNWLIAVPSVYGILVTFTWPESPSWLAYRERYDECRKSFIWLRGEGPEAKRELIELITAQKELRKLKSNYSNLRAIATAFREKEFLKPLTIVVTLTVLVQVTGRQYLLAFIIEIMTKLTGDNSKAYYFTLAFDSMKVFAGLLSSVLIRLLKRRTIIIYSGISLSFVMGIICISSYLMSKGVISATWLVPSLLIAFNAISHIGIIPLTVVLFTEVFPMQYRALGASVNGVVCSILSAIALKVTPIMLDGLDLHGTFLIYFVIAVFSLVRTIFILPETKDRTLQNIELDFMDVKIKFDEEEEDTCLDTVRKPLNETEIK